MSKLLLITDWFYPGYKAGGPIKSTTNLSLALQNKIDVYVFTSDRDLNDDKPYENVLINQWHKIFEKVNIFYCDNQTIGYKKIKEQIQQVNPDCIYLNHMFSFKYVLLPWIVWYFNFKKQCKLVVAPRGALFPSALYYKNKYPKKRVVLNLIKLLGLHKAVWFHATNEDEKAAVEKEFGKVNCKVINNLPSYNQPKLEVITKTKNELSIVFIARIVAIKNLLLLLDSLQLVQENIKLTIAGPIEDEAYWQSCKSIIQKLPSNIQVQYIGAIDQDEVQHQLAKHHIYCLPTKGENFGHSIFEAFLCGKPAIISNRTPWQKLHDLKAGWDVQINDSKELAGCIRAAAVWDQLEYNAYCEGAWNLAHDYIHNSNLLKDYYELFG